MPLLARSVGLPMLPSDRNAWASGNQASSAPGTNGKKLAARNGLIQIALSARRCGKSATCNQR